MDTQRSVCSATSSKRMLTTIDRRHFNVLEHRQPSNTFYISHMHFFFAHARMRVSCITYKSMYTSLSITFLFFLFCPPICFRFPILLFLFPFFRFSFNLTSILDHFVRLIYFRFFVSPLNVRRVL